VAEPRRSRNDDTASPSREYLYSEIIAADNPFYLLRHCLDWWRVAGRFGAAYAGEGTVGLPPYEPMPVLKISLFARPCAMSEHQVEQAATYHLGVKCFLGLAVDERRLDQATLTQFRARLRADGRQRLFQEAFGDSSDRWGEQEMAVGSLPVLAGRSGHGDQDSRSLPSSAPFL